MSSSSSSPSSSASASSASTATAAGTATASTPSSASSAQSLSSSIVILEEDNASTSLIDEAKKCPACCTSYNSNSNLPIVVRDLGLSLTLCHSCVKGAIDSVRSSSSSSTASSAKLALPSGRELQIPLNALDKLLVVDLAAQAHARADVVALNHCDFDECEADASHRCVNCAESYCDEHTALHQKSKASRHHSIGQIGSVSTAKSPLSSAIASAVTICLAHAHLRAPECILWCHDCVLPLCMYCNASNACDRERVSELSSAAGEPSAQRVIAETVSLAERMVQECARTSRRMAERSSVIRAHGEHVVERLEGLENTIVAIIRDAIASAKKMSAEEKESVDAHKLRLDSTLVLLSSQLRALQEVSPTPNETNESSARTTTPLVLASRVRKLLRQLQPEVFEWHRSRDYQSVQFELDKTVTKGAAKGGAHRSIADETKALDESSVVQELKKQMRVSVRATNADVAEFEQARAGVPKNVLTEEGMLEYMKAKDAAVAFVIACMAVKKDSSLLQCAGWEALKTNVARCTKDDAPTVVNLAVATVGGSDVSLRNVAIGVIGAAIDGAVFESHLATFVDSLMTRWSTLCLDQVAQLVLAKLAEKASSSAACANGFAKHIDVLVAALVVEKTSALAVKFLRILVKDGRNAVAMVMKQPKRVETIVQWAIKEHNPDDVAHVIEQTNADAVLKAFADGDDALQALLAPLFDPYPQMKALSKSNGALVQSKSWNLQASNEHYHCLRVGEQLFVSPCSFSRLDVYDLTSRSFFQTVDTWTGVYLLGIAYHPTLNRLYVQWTQSVVRAYVPNSTSLSTSTQWSRVGNTILP